VVAKPDQHVSAEDIMDLCKQRLASYKCVKDVRFIDALPKNPVGKVVKTVLRSGSILSVINGDKAIQ
jgi:acyl-CoA synthetase (AMP-forming)/AMP-acid ligase II